MIPLIDLKREYHSIKDKMEPAILEVIAKGEFIGGQQLSLLEENFANYIATKYSVGVASGTAALFLGLKALGIGPGDEVITTAMSFNATPEAIVYTGATPVFVDVDKKTGQLDLALIEGKITSNTKAILVVHLYGIMSDMDMLLDICQRNKLFLVEDCAQAHGAEYHGKKAGSFGDIGAFSFMPAKNIGCYGDGGIITCNSEEIVKKLRMLRDHGRSSKYEHTILGYAERLDTLQATVINVKLPYLSQWNLRRREIAKKYIRGLKGIQVLEYLENITPSYYVFPILVSQREELQSYLKKCEIATGVYYPIPLHMQPVFYDLGYKKGDMVNAEYIGENMIAIPMNPFLTDDEVEYIISSINSFTLK